MANEILDINLRYYVGDRPKWDDVTLDDTNYRLKYSHGLNWMNQVLTVEELKQETLKYIKRVKEEDLVFFVNIEPIKFLNIGKICALINDGCPISIYTQKFLDQRLASLKELEVTIQVDEFIQVKTSKEKKSLDVFTKIIDQIDLFIMNGSNLKVLEYLNKEHIDLKIAKMVRVHLKNRVIALSTERECIKSDNIRFIDDEKLKYDLDLSSHINLIGMALTDIDIYLGNTQAAKLGYSKQLSAKDMKKLSKALDSVKYKIYDDTFKIQSIGVEKIVGSQMLITFNTKNRKLAYFYAKDDAGLSLKGTSIINYDEMKSVQKTLRNQDGLLSHLQQSSDHRARIVFNRLSTKSTYPNNRLNNHVILLKAFKQISVLK